MSHQAGCQVFVETLLGIQEYTSDSTSVGGWKKAQLILWGLTGIPEPSVPITAVSTYDYGGTEVAVVYPSITGRIAVQSNTGKGFKLSIIPLKPVSAPTFLTSVAWKNSDGSKLWVPP